MKTKLQKTFSITLALLLALALLPARTVQAQVVKNEVPVGLLQAVLDSTTQPFQGSSGGYTASAKDLTYDLTASGLQAQADGLQWGLSLHGFGRETRLTDVSTPEMVQAGDKLKYQHLGLTEWYRDTALGMEQGFTVFQPPQGSGPLVLQLALATDLKSVPDADGGGLSFRTADGQTLRYDHLLARDANGVALHARLVSRPGKILLQVDDSKATYPLTIDPLIYLQRKIVASDGAMNDGFGTSVAISGNTALVGAENANSGLGAAYVFVRSGTSWSQQAKLTVSGIIGFGGSVALSADTALVGAAGDTVGSHTSQGSAYVFVRSGTVWSQQKKLTASDGAAYDFFGSSVAISGGTALVGAAGDTMGKNFGQGSAYVFVRSGTAWSQQTKLTASDGAAYNWFGASVALSGDTALVGAYGVNVGAKSQQGSAYVFVRSGMAWSQQKKLIASDGVAGDQFGGSVALSGDTALVGAMGDDVGTNINQGSAYVFVRSGTAWSQQAHLIASDGAAYDYFGFSVALSGDTALVGAYQDTVGTNSAQGSAYVFVRSGTAWSQQAKLIASDGAAHDWFGVSVALSGDTALVGAYQDTVGTNTYQGSAYLYQAYHELALNGGFNTYVGTSKIPQYWTAANFATTDGKDTTVKKVGTASLKIAGASGKTKTLTQTKSLSGSSGDAFLFSFWVKGTSIPAAGVCEAQVLLYNGTTLKLTKTIACPTGLYLFQKKSLSFTTTNVYTKAVIKITYAKSTGTVWFDALSLMKAP